MLLESGSGGGVGGDCPVTQNCFTCRETDWAQCNTTGKFTPCPAGAIDV